MGGTSSSTSTTTQGTTPYGAAAAPLNGILGNVGAIDPKLSPTEVNALATMSANAGTGASPFSPAISGAANSLLSGGLLSQFNQNANTNKLAGITASDAALTAQNYGPLQQLAIEAQRRGIPLSTMAQQMGLVMPAAQAFGTTTGNTQGTQTMSGAQQFGTIAQGVGTVAAMMF
jgi:hypothetical protein